MSAAVISAIALVWCLLVVVLFEHPRWFYSKKYRWCLPPIDTHESDTLSTEQRSQAARAIKTRTVFWWLAHH